MLECLDSVNVGWAFAAATVVYLLLMGASILPKSGDFVWTPWFAWRPVRVDGEWIWGQRVERMFCQLGSECHWTEYRRFTAGRI